MNVRKLIVIFVTVLLIALVGNFGPWYIGFSVRGFYYNIPYQIFFLTGLIAVFYFSKNKYRNIFIVSVLGLVKGYFISMIAIIIAYSFFFREGEYLEGLRRTYLAISEGGLYYGISGYFRLPLVMYGWMHGLIVSLIVWYFCLIRETKGQAD